MPHCYTYCALKPGGLFSRSGVRRVDRSDGHTIPRPSAPARAHFQIAPAGSAAGGQAPDVTEVGGRETPKGGIDRTVGAGGNG